MARSFNGTSDSFSASSQTWNNRFAISAWIKPTDVSGQQQIVDRDPSSRHFQFRLNGSALEMVTILGGVYTASVSTVSAGVWQHVFGMIDGSGNVYAALDGTLSTAAGPNSNTGSLATGTDIGMRRSGAWFDGDIADVACWHDSSDAGLGQTEISALAAGVSPLLIRPDTLKHYWRGNAASGNEIDSITGETWTDNSAAGYAEGPLVSVGWPSNVLAPAGPVAGANAFEFDSSSDTADTYDVYAYQENGADVSDVVLVGSYTVSAGGGGLKAGTLSLLGVGT